eukprot:gene19783-25305_t
MPDGLLLSSTSEERTRLLAESEVFCMSVEHEFYLPVEFETLQEYLQLLEASARALSSLNERVCFYLAAAVSDFYIPEDQMVQHKIQSSTGLTLELEQVPKVFGKLVDEWAPKAFVVSFKLETDESILFTKAWGAIEKYH